MSDNGGWIRKLLMWDWHAICAAKWPGWELVDGKPAAVKLEHVNGRGESSHELSSAWDDVADWPLYQRDWTADNSPFVCQGETYWSGWWFERVCERDRFLRWALERGAREGSLL